MALGTWNGSACQIVIAKDDAKEATVVIGAVSALGNLCVRVYDAGGLTQATDYQLEVDSPVTVRSGRTAILRQFRLTTKGFTLMKGLACGAALVALMAVSPVSRPDAGVRKRRNPPPPAPPQPTPPAPFPEGAKIAYVVLQRVASESAEGKAATAQIQALQQKRAAELNERNKQLQGIQAKLEKEASVMSATAQADLAKQAEKLNTEIQRFTQDAQQEITELQEQLRQQFESPRAADPGRGPQGKGPALHLQRARFRSGRRGPRARHLGRRHQEAGRDREAK